MRDMSWILAVLLVSTVATGARGHGEGGRTLLGAPEGVQLSAAVTTFGGSLLDAVLSQGEAPEEGAFVSPFSVAQAMGMLLNGADPVGESSSQLLSVVFDAQQGSGLGVDKINADMASLEDVLMQVPANATNLTLSNANSVWVDEFYILQPQFEDALEKYYSAVAEPITTAEAVNEWVSNATHGKIQEVVDQDTLDQWVLVLINALYFKGAWQVPFDIKATHPQNFSLLSGSQVDVAMMTQLFDRESHLVAHFSAPSNKKKVPCVAVKLGFEGGAYAAVLAMPSGRIIGEAQGALQLSSPKMPYADALAACRKELLSGSANTKPKALQGGILLHLPRFEVEFKSSLKKPLRSLGVSKPFDASSPSDLTQLAIQEDGEPADNLVVDDVVHKVYVKVSEQGAEAAAVTVVGIKPTSAAPPQEPEVIEFDRPFSMLVVHDSTQTVLFLGEVHSPEKWTGAES